jgi:sec-independent protein translocase protein TatA
MMFYLAVIGWMEWLLIGLGIMLLFGARKLPQLARSMGSSVNEFKKGLKEGAAEDSSSAPESPRLLDKDK